MRSTRRHSPNLPKCTRDRRRGSRSQTREDPRHIAGRKGEAGKQVQGAKRRRQPPLPRLRNGTKKIEGQRSTQAKDKRIKNRKPRIETEDPTLGPKAKTIGAGTPKPHASKSDAVGAGCAKSPLAIHRGQRPAWDAPMRRQPRHLANKVACAEPIMLEPNFQIPKRDRLHGSQLDVQDAIRRVDDAERHPATFEPDSPEANENRPRRSQGGLRSCHCNNA